MHDQIHLCGADEDGVNVHPEQIALRHLLDADTNSMGDVLSGSTLHLFEAP